MSSPIHSRSPSPIPSTSSQPTEEQFAHKALSLEQISLLISQLLTYPLKKTTQGDLKKKLRLRNFDPVFMKVTSDQLKSIVNETSKTADEVASAILKCNIDLYQKISSSSLLTPQETTNIKLTLSNIALPSTSSTTSATPALLNTLLSNTRSATGDICPLPIKKQKFRWGYLATPSMSLIHESLYSTGNPPECSPKMLITFLEHISQNSRSKTFTPFSCPNQHTEDLCNECQPLGTLIKNVTTPNLGATAWQLETLLKYTSPTLLANSLTNNPAILKRVLEGSHILNYQLTLIINDCQISPSFYRAGTQDPRRLSSIYRILNNIVYKGLESPLLKTILAVWSKDQYPCTKAEDMKLINTTGSIQLVTIHSLAAKLPVIERCYQRTKLYRKNATYVKSPTTKNFNLLVSGVILKTLACLEYFEEGRSLLIDTPVGKIPSTDLLEPLFCIIILTYEKWQLSAPSCKASINQLSQDTSMEEEAHQRLRQALKNFVARNNLSLPQA